MEAIYYWKPEQWTCYWLTGWSLLLFASLWRLANVPDENTGTTQTRTGVWNLLCAQMAHVLSPQLVSKTYPHTNTDAGARTHDRAHSNTHGLTLTFGKRPPILFWQNVTQQQLKWKTVHLYSTFTLSALQKLLLHPVTLMAAVTQDRASG